MALATAKHNQKNFRSVFIISPYELILTEWEGRIQESVSKTKSESKKKLDWTTGVNVIRGKFLEYKDPYVKLLVLTFSMSGLRQILKKFSFSSSIKLDDSP